MRNTVLGALGLAMLCVGITVQAHADAVFTLNQSTAFSNATAGTVDLTQNGTDNVLVTVTLNPNFYFIQTGLSFAFELSGVSNATASSVTPDFASQGPGTYNTPYGTWNYAFNSAAPPASLCAKAYSSDGLCNVYGDRAPFSQAGQTLSFDLTATGLTPSNFVANGSYYFMANLLDGNGNPGTVLAGDPSSVTPEPSSLLLSGTGLLSLAGFLRRRATAASTR